MTNETSRKDPDEIIYLTGCAVNQKKPDLEKIRGIDSDWVLETAKEHKLGAAVSMALESAGIRTPETAKAIALAQRRNTLLDTDRTKIIAALEKAGIWYMPLKGAILKDLYPRYGMRQMADNDILFDAGKANEVREIMRSLGFKCVKFGRTHSDDYENALNCRFEMHRCLFDTYRLDKLNRYYQNIHSRLIKDEDNRFGYHFTDEDFYIYLNAHEYKHFSGGGTGLRSLLDIYVYLKKKGSALNQDYIRQECEKLGISDFEEKNRNLALHLFDGQPLSEAEEAMLKYVFSSGAYGKVANNAENRISEKGRKGYFLSRLTLPKEIMYRDYPVLKKAPFLYPVMWVWRLIYRFFTHNRTFMYQLKAALGLVKKKE